MVYFFYLYVFLWYDTVPRAPAVSASMRELLAFLAAVSAFFCLFFEATWASASHKRMKNAKIGLFLLTDGNVFWESVLHFRTMDKLDLDRCHKKNVQVQTLYSGCVCRKFIMDSTFFYDLVDSTLTTFLPVGILLNGCLSVLRYYFSFGACIILSRFLCPSCRDMGVADI